MVIAALSVLVHVAVILRYVLPERREPSATLAWLLAVVFLPFLGLVLYLLVGRRRFVARHEAIEEVEARVDALLEARAEEGWGADGVPAAPDPRTADLLALASATTRAQITGGNASSLLIDGARTYRHMLLAMEDARDHIHVIFYIWRDDSAGLQLRDRLVRRAQAGIEVRVLVDAIGCLSLPSDFFAPLIEAGGQAARFSPVRLPLRWRRRDRVNYRNHRKLVVIDGRVGLTGGINVGREYLGLNPDIGRWRDTHVRLEGSSALSLGRTFIEDWLHATGELLDAPRYLPQPLAPPPGQEAVLVVPSGPDQRWGGVLRLHERAIAQATRRVWITNPYFLPDRVMMAELETAALRGVDVRILVPQRTDSLVVTLGSVFYQAEVLEAGVKIYRYARGFVHAKTLVVDDWLASVGSANMDMRSFHLNFELQTYLFDEERVRELASHFLDDLRHAHRVELETLQAPARAPERLLASIARLFAPLL